MANEIIRKEDGGIQLAAEFAKEVAETVRLAAEIEAKKKKIAELLVEAMSNAGVLQLKAESEDAKLLVSYVEGFDRETFDSKAFRAAHPDLYDEYVKMSSVKPTVRIKVQ